MSDFAFPSAPMFAVGQRVFARMNGVYRPAVVEDVETDEAAPSGARYYIHWPDFDRRQDAWLPAEDVRPSHVGRNATAKNPAAKNAKVAGVSTRTMLRNSATAVEAVGSPVTQTPKNVAPPKDSKFFSRPRNIRGYVFGEHEVDAWYFSPLPLADAGSRAALDECWRNCAMSPDAALRVSTHTPAASPGMTPNSMTSRTSSSLLLHVCPYCVTVFGDHESLERGHLPVCKRYPPGREVYRDAKQGVAVFEADGSIHRGYAERLALISKSFLEHKSLDYDTTPFVFYTVCFITNHGCVVAGYFSREKRNPDRFNLSCLLTLPQHQGRGLGRFLVDMSYELSRREGRFGSPEKPLSDLGQKTYHSFWREAVLDALLPLARLEGLQVQLSDLMAATGMVQQDVLWALRSLHMIDQRTQEIVVHITAQMTHAHLEAKLRRIARGDVRFEPCLLAWRPSDYGLVTVTRDELLSNTMLIPAVAARPGEKRSR